MTTGQSQRTMSEATATSQPPPLAAGRYYGDIAADRRLQGLVLTEVVHGSGRKLPTHSHELAYFCLLLEGRYWERLGRRTRNYGPFTIGFYPPAITHTDEIGSGGARFFTIEIETEWLDRLKEYGPVPPISANLHGGELVWLASRLYREFKEGDARSPLVIEGIALEMMAFASRTNCDREVRRPEWLLRVVELMRSEFSRPITVAELAASADVHPFYLSRVFRRFYGRTVGEYLQGLRIQQACADLADTRNRLVDIALAGGFADQSHFTRVFKQTTGMTPSAFRNSLRKNNCVLKPSKTLF